MFEFEISNLNIFVMVVKVTVDIKYSAQFSSVTAFALSARSTELVHSNIITIGQRPLS